MQLTNIAVYSDLKMAQIRWYVSQLIKDSSKTESNRSDDIITAARDYLLARGEPSHYLQLHIAILAELGRKDLLILAETPAENYSRLQQEIQETLNYQKGFLRFGGSEKSLDVGQWWLVDDRKASTPLSDRVEMAVVKHLIQNPDCAFTEMESIFFNEGDTDGDFGGFLIPETALVGECLESYGEKLESGWRIRDQDAPVKRREEIASMAALISGLGNELGFRVQMQTEDPPKSIWLDKNEKPLYVFYFSASALLGKFLLEIEPIPTSGIIVLPGGRANLVMYKLSRDPRLQKIFDQGWRFLKYRHARRLANNSSLTADNLESQLILDPLTYNETQLRMF
jgi:hypothetical protein